jgi:hypothetical protein
LTLVRVGAAFALIVAVTVIAAFGAFERSSGLTQTSDSAQSFVEGYAVAHGNPLLSGWNVPLDDYYFTDTLPYAAAEITAGPKPFLLAALPALSYALFVCVTLIVCLDRRRSLLANIAAGAAILLMFGAPAATGSWNPLLLSDMHFASVVGALISLGLCDAIARHRAGRRMGCAAVLILAVTATVASDPFSLVFAFGPALLLLSVDARLGRQRLTLVLVVAGTITGFVLPFLIARSGGFTTENIVVTGVVPFGLFGRNLAALLAGVLSLFGANPFGAVPTVSATVVVTMRLATLALAAFAIVATTRHSFGALPLIDRLLCAGILVDLLACALSIQFGKGIVDQTLWHGGSPMRYVMPAVLFSMVLGARCGARLISNLDGVDQQAIACGACAFLAVANIVLNGLGKERPFAASNAEALAAAHWLETKGLRNGAGEYWSSNLVTAMSGNQVRIRSLIPRGDSVVPYVLSADRTWYRTPPQFVIWQDGNKTGLTLSDVRASHRVCATANIATYRIALLTGCGPAPHPKSLRDFDLSTRER